MQQNHIIHKKIVEITFSNKSKVQELFNEMSTILNQKISLSTNRILDEIIPSNTLISFNSLDINLDSLSYPINEKELIDAYELALKNELELRLKHLDSTNHNGSEHHHQLEHKYSAVDILSHFLQKGVWLFWGDINFGKNPTELFNLLLKQDEKGLKSLLLNIGKETSVRTRFVNQFPEQNIKDGITLIEPTQANYIITYHHNISNLQQNVQLIKSEIELFKKSLWLFIITYLLVEKSSHFERKMFVKSTLTQLAAHYNLSYNEVLQLFSQAIKTERIRTDNTLQSIILDLENEKSQPTQLNEQPTLLHFLKDELSSTDNEILIYYLVHGSLPSRYQHYSETLIELLIANEIKNNPNRFKAILKKQELAPKLSIQLSNTLSNPTLIEIVNILQPTQTNFITNYHNTTLKIQNKKSIVKTEESEFRKSLWQFILLFLLNDRGSLFNTKSFVESHIRQMANHYNMSFTNLLLFLSQGIGEELLNNNSASSLFQIISSILHEQKALTDKHPIKKNDLKDLDKIDKADPNQPLYIHNLLLFWLTRGYLPWWSNDKNTINPHTLLTQFINSNPQQGLHLFKLAIQNKIAPTISLKKVIKEITILIKLLPNGDNALGTLNILSQISLPQNKGNINEIVQEILVVAMLDTYHENQFSKFDQSLYLKIFLNSLKHQLGLQQIEIIKQIIASLKRNGTVPAIFLANTLHRLAKLEIEDVSYSEREKASTLKSHKQLLNMDTDTTANEKLTFAVELLSYFLQHNKFPITYKIKNEQEINTLINEILLLIYHLDAIKLNTLFEKANNSPQALMRIHNLVLVANNQQFRNIENILSPYLITNTIRYINEVGVTNSNISEINELLKWIELKNSSTLHHNTLHSLLKKPAVAHLIAEQTNKEAFNNILHHLTNNKNREIIKSYTYLLELAISDSFEHEKLLINLREFSINWFVTTSQTSMRNFFQEFLTFLSQRKNWNMTRMHEQIKILSTKISNQKEVSYMPLVQQMLAKSDHFTSQIEHQENLQTSQNQIEKKIIKETLGSIVEISTQNDMPNKTEQTKKPFKLNEGEKIYIQNAGMVLIHPFIATFFTRVGLTESGKFTTTEAQHRASHLLQYLVNNSIETPEHEMVLNKILCGLPIEEPIINTIEITETEKETAQGLLAAVIQNWDKMKNSSVEGLQASFLQREGMLSENDEEWILKIEQRTYDLLLQTLPWGLSMIKLPWMNKPIMVEWS